MEEFYPMPMFVKLLVRDVSASAKWYRAALGFRSVYALAGDDDTQIMNHLQLGRYQDLILIAQPQPLNESSRGLGVVINLTIEKGIRNGSDRRERKLKVPRRQLGTPGR